MRLLGTLPDANRARTFADYLLSLAIEARLEQASEGWAVWVCDEDKLARAREELRAFERDPAEERFRAGARAGQRRRAEDAPAPAPRPALERFPSRPAEPQRQLTLGLILASVLITALFHSPQYKAVVARHLFITGLAIDGEMARWRDGLPELQRGEVWRLVTPMFIHFDALHLLFNMLWLSALGSQIEMRYGSRWLLLLVMLVAVASNLCEYFFGTVTLDGWMPVVPQPSAYFGGMSGVVFGLFGFVWMKTVYEPGSGLFVSPGSVLLMMLWLLLCMTGAVGRIANMAHLVGLSVGMLAGYAGAWWNDFGGGVPEAPGAGPDEDEE